MKYELVFWGGARAVQVPVLKNYKRQHPTIADARKEALRVLAQLPNRAAHPGMIYDTDTDKQVATVN